MTADCERSQTPSSVLEATISKATKSQIPCTQSPATVFPRVTVALLTTTSNIHPFTPKFSESLTTIPEANFK